MKSGIKASLGGILFLGIILNGCGGDAALPTTVQEQVQNQVSQAEKIPELISSINQINARLDKLEKMKFSSTDTIVAKPVTDKPAVSQNPAATVKKVVDKTVMPAPEPVKASAATDDAKGRKILDKIVATFNAAGGIEMVYDKYEKNPATGKVRDTGTHLWAKNPGTVLFELTRNPEDKGKEGTKIKYNINDSQAKARSTGIASITTVTLDFKDERIVSPNGYLLNQADIYSLMKRLKSSAYSGELTGKTSVGGSEVYIIKVKSKESNSMDPKITYETIGFNPKDFTLRLWEAYAKDNDKPFLKLAVSKFQLLSSVSEEQLKL